MRLVFPVCNPKGFVIASTLLLMLIGPFAIGVIAEDYKKEFGFSAGYSPGSTTGIGVTEGQQFFQTCIDFGFVLYRWQDVSFKYKASLIPVAFIHGDQATLQLRSNRMIYGGGADPIGLQFNFRSQKRLQPFLAGSGGFLYFTEQIPVANSSQYNFTFSFIGGSEYMTGGKHSILFGYRYHHISNANTGNVNPGIDSHVMFAGLSFKR